MSWWKYLWPWSRRGRIEAEREADEQFKAQLREAVLRQDDLREAAAQMKRAIKNIEETTKSVRPPPRSEFT